MPDLHKYLSTRYPERGLSNNRERPLYEVSDDELYRAVPGEVCVHHSHPGRPIHAETNPCPEGRGLYVLDWTDIPQIARDDDGKDPAAASTKSKRNCKVLPCHRMPLGTILDRMRVLSDNGAPREGRPPTSSEFIERLQDVATTAKGLREVASQYIGGLDGFLGALRDGRDEGLPAQSTSDVASSASCRTRAIPLSAADAVAV